MATYKVPQDVEADDKLIGPFSFRQFIYLIIVALAGAMAWGLAQLFVGLAIIPLPIILLFGALALPLRKDQPMEIYLAAIISYYLKPHKRLWDPDGIESLIEITVPKIAEVQRSKNISQADAEQRFSYLAGIVDSGGWAIRGAGAQPQSVVLNNDILLEAQGAEDVLDTNNSIAQNFNSMMNRESDRIRQEAIDRMRQSVVVPPPVTQDPATMFAVPTPPQAAVGVPIPAPFFNPYPEIQQTVIQPLSTPSQSAIPSVAQEMAQALAPQPVAAPAPVAAAAPIPVPTPIPETPPTTSDNVASAGIMNLANNADDLSIETIAHEARRIQEKEADLSEEVVISLR